MGSDTSDRDLKTVFKDKRIIDQAIRYAVKDPEVIQTLAEDVASELAEQMEDDPVVRTRLLKACMTNPEFKKKVLEELRAELRDD